MGMLKCPKCGNNRLNAEDKFCWNCGLELWNRCVNPECDSDVRLPDEFTYCPNCGSETWYTTLQLAGEIEF